LTFSGTTSPHVSLQTLREQGDTWRSLLTGELPTTSLLTPDAYVEASTIALRRTRQLAYQVLRQSAGLVAIVLTATGALLAISVTGTAGATRWLSAFASLASGLGLSGAAVRSGVVKVAAAAERPIWRVSKADALAAAITRVPRTHRPRKAWTGIFGLN
jgi:hypothetical protein